MVAALPKLAADTSEKAAFPVFLLIVAVVFLAVQDRIDRNDPKLALAPVHAEPDLPFPDQSPHTAPPLEAS